MNAIDPLYPVERAPFVTKDGEADHPIDFQPFVPQPYPEQHLLGRVNYPINPAPEGAPEEPIQEEIEGAPQRPLVIPAKTDAQPSAPPAEQIERSPRKKGISRTRIYLPPVEKPAKSEIDILLVVLGALLMLAALLTTPIVPLSIALLTLGSISMIAGIVNENNEVNVPLRYQWNENNGYCGECCTIAAGLKFGQYFSQYDARAIADTQSPTSKPQVDCQLLLGENDAYTASEMRLNSIEWDTSTQKSTDDFLVWVKEMITQGNPVSIGLYTNEYLFYGDTKPNAGQPDYDHIVSVTKIESKYSDGKYHEDDVIYFSDNALWNPPPGPPQYIFSATFGEIQKSRKQANAKDGPIYSLCNNSSVGNFGIAITGIMDLHKETFPVRVDTNVNYESPEIVDQSNDRPAPMDLDLTVTVSGLEPGVKYILYRYDNEQSVPTSNFNGQPGIEPFPFEIASGSTFVHTQTIKSNEKAIYRAVLAPVNTATTEE